MINSSTLSFLRDIKKNNNKDWFEKNKERYLTAKDNVAKVIDSFLVQLCTFEKKFRNLSQKEFKKYFGALDEAYKLKTTPKGYDKGHADIELLRLNSFIVWHKYSDKEIANKNFVKELSKGSKIMKPFLDFLNVGID